MPGLGIIRAHPAPFMTGLFAPEFHPGRHVVAAVRGSCSIVCRSCTGSSTLKSVMDILVRRAWAYRRVVRIQFPRTVIIVLHL